MNLFKKIYVPGEGKKELTAYESWTVRWLSRYGEFSRETKEEAEVFTSKEDADAFAEALREANRLLKNTSKTRVIVEKND